MAAPEVAGDLQRAISFRARAQTGDLLASPDAVRQARYAERMKAKGMRQRKFWLTDDEYEALRECLEELRAAQGGGSDPASA